LPELKRTWSVPTSPRSPYKLPHELSLLKEFEGQLWNRHTQTLFAKKLAKSSFFQGTVSKKEPDFSARDRINRAPKTFGFVRFDNGRRIEITDAGSRLISNKRLEELFLKQLLKWQYPSPKHQSASYHGFRIKPFLETLRLIKKLGGLTKREISIFVLPLIDWKDYEKTKQEIIDFREKSKKYNTKIECQTYANQLHKEKFRHVYNRELAESLKLRESSRRQVDQDSFLATKIRNSIDYSDAAIRYFRATGLFTISSRTYRLQILDTKLQVVEEILSKTAREPLNFLENEAIFLDLLSNPDYPKLPDDNKQTLITEIMNIFKFLEDKSHNIPKIQLSPSYLNTLDIEQLKDKKEELERLGQKISEQEQLKQLQTYSLYAEISQTFEKIRDFRCLDIPDKPLFLEWNIWRALNMLDDGTIQGNLLLDLESKPLRTAPGNMPDMVCYYKDFVLVVEVTLARGARQYEIESEPVSRHLASVRKNLRQKGDRRPVYGLFIAATVNPAVIAHFYILRRTNIQYYDGTISFIPMNVQTFMNLLEIANTNGGVTSSQLYKFIRWADKAADGLTEEDWFNAISAKASNWI